MRDRILTADEIPIFWRLDEQKQAAFLRFARKLERRAVQIAGVYVYLAPISEDFNPTALDAMDSNICGMSAIEEILERDRNSRG